VSVMLRDMKGKAYATEVRVCNAVINRIQVTAADTVPGKKISSGAQFDVTARLVLRRRKGTSIICYDCAQRIQSVTSPHHKNREY
jgi:hypothetical protein